MRVVVIVICTICDARQFLGVFSPGADRLAIGVPATTISVAAPFGVLIVPGDDNAAQVFSGEIFRGAAAVDGPQKGRWVRIFNGMSVASAPRNGLAPLGSVDI